MAKNYFVTGTDTDAGKTLITSALLLNAAQKNLRCLGLKPVAAGGLVPVSDGSPALGNDDAVKLMAASTVKLPYAQVNPVLFEEPIAPHIAAEKHGRHMTLSSLSGYVRGALMTPADVRFIEGAGGWMVPLNRREPLSGLAKELDIPVILVVGMKLGCLNHALLTAKAIRMDGLTLAGWVATQVDPDMACVEENLTSLKHLLAAPCLGTVPYQEGVNAEDVAALLDIEPLLSSPADQSS